jgi:hypothetical protein
MSCIHSAWGMRGDSHCGVKAFLLGLVIILTVLPARADIHLKSEVTMGPKVKHSLMVVPRAMQRTALNMVTFRNRELAIQQWLDIAVTFADAETTRRSIDRGSTESNPFLGTRPSAPRTYITLLAVGFSYGTMTQVIHDRVERPRLFEFGVTGMATLSHAFVAYHNTTVCPGNLTCNPQPVN